MREPQPHLPPSLVRYGVHTPRHSLCTHGAELHARFEGDNVDGACLDSGGGTGCDLVVGHAVAVLNEGEDAVGAGARGGRDCGAQLGGIFGRDPADAYAVDFCAVSGEAAAAACGDAGGGAAGFFGDGEAGLAAGGIGAADAGGAAGRERVGVSGAFFRDGTLADYHGTRA